MISPAHDYDIICISESFLNSDYATDDPRLLYPGLCYGQI